MSLKRVLVALELFLLLAFARPAFAGDCFLTKFDHDQLRWMLTLAKNRDESGIMDMRKYLSKNKYVRQNFIWALWLANPEKYRTQFIDSVPLDYQVFIACAHDDLVTTGYPFPFAYFTLFEYAKKGNVTAIRKMIQAQTDGVITELQTEYIARTAESSPHAVLEASRYLKDADREMVVCNIDWDYDSRGRNRFLSTTPKNSIEVGELASFKRLARTCRILK